MMHNIEIGALKVVAGARRSQAPSPYRGTCSVSVVVFFDASIGCHRRRSLSACLRGIGAMEGSTTRNDSGRNSALQSVAAQAGNGASSISSSATPIASAMSLSESSEIATTA